MILGVDVSSYTTTVDWPQLRTNGIQFAYARTCDGLNEDKLYRLHTIGARNAGVAIGGYQFGHPSMNVKDCAEFFLSLVSMVELRPVVDLETLSQGHVPDNAGEWADQWCELVKAAMLSLWPDSVNARRGPIVYASTSYMAVMRDQKRSAFGPTGWDWWDAEYRAGVGVHGDPTQPMRAGAIAWQYSGDVAIKGQVGLFDEDVAADLDRLRV